MKPANPAASYTDFVRIYILCLAVAVVLPALAGGSDPACAQTVDPVGVAGLADLNQLPRLRTHTQVRQVSSYDPTGGNDDGFYSVNFLYVDLKRGEFVLLEEQGPGCIGRIQMADLASYYGPPVRIRIYLDGASTPQIDMPLADLFSGKKPPFLAPLVGASHSSSQGTYGFYAYTPIPFQSGVRVALTGLVHFYNITYHTYRPGIGTVPTWGKDRPIQDAIQVWNKAGTRPTPRRAGQTTRQVPLRIEPSRAATVLDLQGAGAIDALEFRLAPLGQGGPDLDDVHLEIYWDHETTPSVNVPLSLFFLARDAHSPARSLLTGHDGDGRLYCFFPMPFWTRARIRVVNRGTLPLEALATVDYTAGVTPAYPAATTGYFRCRVRAEPRTQPGRDFTALATGGRGHVVGLVQEMWGRDQIPYETFLEGDERIYFDFERTPSVHGNGTEDFFNGAYYFLGQTFSRPVHGSPHFRIDAGGPRRLAYRLFLGDALPFRSHIRMGTEAGGVGHLIVDYRAAVFYYHRPEPSLVTADRLDLGDLADEKAHGFAGVVARPTPLVAAYEGDHDDELIRDSGVSLAPGRQCSFRLSIPAANDGLVLRRRLDYLNGGKDDQLVRVEVNGKVAGTWLLRGSYLNHLIWFPNLPSSRGQGRSDKRWRDSSFMVPASLTSGRTTATVKLTNLGTTDWNAFEILALARVPTPAPDLTPPGAPTGLAGAGQYVDDVLLTWDPAPDNVGVERYRIERAASPAGPFTRLGEVYGTQYRDRHAGRGGVAAYYRVCAVDAAGHAGAWTAPVSGTPGRVVHYEAEALLPGVVTPGTRAVQLDLLLLALLGRPWSGDNQMHYAGHGPDNGVRLSFRVPTTAVYAPSVSYTTFNGACSFEVLIDGQPIGIAPNSLAVARRTVSFPGRVLTAGAHTIEFRLVNSIAPYTGNQILIDCFRFTP